MQLRVSVPTVWNHMFVALEHYMLGMEFVVNVHSMLHVCYWIQQNGMILANRIR